MTLVWLGPWAACLNQTSAKTHRQHTGLPPLPSQPPASFQAPSSIGEGSSSAPPTPTPLSAQHLRPTSAMATPLPYAATGSSSGSNTAPVANGGGGGLHRPAYSTSHMPMQHQHPQHQQPPSQSPSPSGTAALRTEQKQKLASILDNFPSFDSEIKTGIKVGSFSCECMRW